MRKSVVPSCLASTLVLASVFAPLCSSHFDAIAATAPSTVALHQSATNGTDVPPVPELVEHVIADQLVAPWSIAFLPDGRVLVTERSGKVRLIRDGQIAAHPALVVADIKAWVKMGLLGIVIDPQFASNHYVYLAECYGSEQERDSWVRVVRYVMNGDLLESPTTLIDRIPAFLNHSGGRLAFGPDGKLYVTTGDADRPPLSQDLTSLAGKILRLNTDGSIPQDNPFVNRGDVHPAIWSYGHRNPQGLAFRAGAGTLYAPEHGPNGGDEINRIERSANYGWPTISHDRTAPGLMSPLAEFSPAIGPGNASFYSGTMFPELEGDLLVACMRGESLLRIRLNATGDAVVHVERLLHRKYGRIREVAIAPNGAILITTSEIDPPEGRNNPNYDKVIRLTRGEGIAATSALPDANALPRPVGAVAIFATHCAACHGQTAQPALNSSLFDRQWAFGRLDDDLRRNIANGLVDRGMPAFETLLNREEINELVRLIRIREESSPR